MSCLKRFFYSTRSRTPTKPKPRPSQDAAILLQIPLDVLLLIVKSLPRQSLYTLAQSCYVLRTILQQICHLEPVEAPRPSTFQFLDCFRSDPEDSSKPWRAMRPFPRSPPWRTSRRMDLLSSLSSELRDRLFCNGCTPHILKEYCRIPWGEWREYQLNMMMPGCTRSSKCRNPCCHPPHLCSHYRTSMEYVQKQHVELVLQNTLPLGTSDALIEHGMAFPPQRKIYDHSCRQRFWPVSKPAQPLMTVRYTIMSRVVQGRFLLYQQIKYVNVDEEHLDGIFTVLHHGLFDCPTVLSQIQSGRRNRNDVQPMLWFYSDYTHEGKCPYCMAEIQGSQFPGKGIIRLWQDLGSAEEITHACCLDMEEDTERAFREHGTIMKLFGPV